MKTAIVYRSSTGNTEAMANAVAQGAEEAGAQADLIGASGFNSSMVSEYDSIALGCPSMGSEELEEAEFRPMFDDIKASLQSKKTALFGSYGRGDGEWMRNRQSECEENGISLVADGVIANEAPDDEAIEKCRELGKLLA